MMWNQYKREREIAQKWADDRTPVTRREYARHVAFARSIWIAVIMFSIAIAIAAGLSVYLISEQGVQDRQSNFQALCETQQRVSALNAAAARDSAKVYRDVATAARQRQLRIDLSRTALRLDALAEAHEEFTEASCEQVPPPPATPDRVLSDMP